MNAAMDFQAVLESTTLQIAPHSGDGITHIGAPELFHLLLDLAPRLRALKEKTGPLMALERAWCQRYSLLLDEVNYLVGQDNQAINRNRLRDAAMAQVDGDFRSALTNLREIHDDFRSVLDVQRTDRIGELTMHLQDWSDAAPNMRDFKQAILGQGDAKEEIAVLFGGGGSLSDEQKRSIARMCLFRGGFEVGEPVEVPVAVSTGEYNVGSLFGLRVSILAIESEHDYGCHLVLHPGASVSGDILPDFRDTLAQALDRAVMEAKNAGDEVRGLAKGARFIGLYECVAASELGTGNPKMNPERSDAVFRRLEGCSAGAAALRAFHSALTRRKEDGRMVFMAALPKNGSTGELERVGGIPGKVTAVLDHFTGHAKGYADWSIPLSFAVVSSPDQRDQHCNYREAIEAVGQWFEGRGRECLGLEVEICNLRTGDRRVLKSLRTSRADS